MSNPSANASSFSILPVTLFAETRPRKKKMALGGRRNPLKRLDSAKEIQGFSWIFFGRAWSDLARFGRIWVWLGKNQIGARAERQIADEKVQNEMARPCHGLTSNRRRIGAWSAERRLGVDADRRGDKSMRAPRGRRRSPRHSACAARAAGARPTTRELISWYRRSELARCRRAALRASVMFWSRIAS